MAASLRLRLTAGPLAGAEGSGRIGYDEHGDAWLRFDDAWMRPEDCEYHGVIVLEGSDATLRLLRGAGFAMLRAH